MRNTESGREVAEYINQKTKEIFLLGVMFCRAVQVEHDVEHSEEILSRYEHVVKALTAALSDKIAREQLTKDTE